MASWTGVTGSLSGIRVLLVDDDPDTLQSCRSFLEIAGAVVECAESAAKALEGLESFRPDVIVSDLAMPEVSGLDLMRRVRQRADAFSTLPAIALTASHQGVRLNEAIAAGFTRAITKPVEPLHLFRAIGELVKPVA